MIQKQELIKKIKYHFNLNIYESKVWLALLSKNIATVGEVAEASGVPRSRVYDVLESLDKRGFAIAKLGKPVRYLAVKPSVVVEHMKNNMLREVEEKTKTLSDMKENQEYQDLELLYSKGIKPIQPEELSSAIRGRQNAYSFLKNMIEETKKEIILVSTIEALKRKSRFLKPLFEKLRANGVSIKVAASLNPINQVAGKTREIRTARTDKNSEKERAALMSLSRELTVPIRRIKINARFCVVDSSKILVFVTPDSEEDKDIALWINSNFFGKALTTFLTPIWRNKK